MNNAGASFQDGHVGTSSPDAMNLLEKNLDLNLKSWGKIQNFDKLFDFRVMSITNIAKPHLIATKGEVINTSSIMALNFGVGLKKYYNFVSKNIIFHIYRSEIFKHQFVYTCYSLPKLKRPLLVRFALLVFLLRSSYFPFHPIA